MKKTIRTGAALLSMLFCFTTQAQKKEPAGYYISLAGDSVKGAFPDYHKWVHSPKSVAFVKETGEKLLLTPDSCLALLVPGEESYLSYKGQRMTNPVNESSALHELVGYATTTEGITAFIKEIGTANEISFYIYKDAKRANLYYKSGDEIVELKYKAYYQNGAVHEESTYKDQLFALFGGNEKLLQQITEMSYSEESLRTLVYKLNPREKKRTVKKVDPLKGMVLGGGVGINTLRVSGDKLVAATAIEYRRSMTPVIKVGYISPVGRSFGKYFIFPQLTLYSYTNKGETIQRGLTTWSRYKASSVAAASVNFGITLMNRANTRVFLAPGVGLMAIMGNRIIEEAQISVSPEARSYRTTKGKDLTFGLNMQAGMAIKNRGLLWIGYSAPTTVTNQIYYTAKHASIQVGGGIKL